MIRQRRGNDFLLISQHDHALLSGQLARRIGNARFTSPLPFGPVITGIELHDCAWPSHDDFPTINDFGLPRHVFESQIEKTLPIWSATVDRVSAIHPYAGLLTSLHAMNLSFHAMARMKDNVDPTARLHWFKCSQFQHRQIEIQENLRTQLNMRIDLALSRGLAEPNRSPEEDNLLRNFRLLEFLDQLSLNLCFGELIFHEVDHIYPQPGGSPIKLQLARGKDAAITIDPWPFDEKALEFPLPCRSVEARNYSSDEDLGLALNGALQETICVRVHSY